MKGFIAILVNEDAIVEQVDIVTTCSWVQEKLNEKVVVNKDNLEECILELVKDFEAGVVRDYVGEEFMEDVNNVYGNIYEKVSRSYKKSDEEIRKEYCGLEEEVNDILGEHWIEDCEVVKYSISFEYDTLFIWLFK